MVLANYRQAGNRNHFNSGFRNDLDFPSQIPIAIHFDCIYFAFNQETSFERLYLYESRTKSMRFIFSFMITPFSDLKYGEIF